MYRRYYQRYDNPRRQMIQQQGRRTNENTSEEDLQENYETDYDDNEVESDSTIDEVNITAQPEIIFPEKSTSSIDDIEEDTESSGEYINSSGINVDSKSEATISRNRPLFLGKFKLDDLLILALILIFLLEGAQDPLILILLAFLFFMGL